MTDGDDADYLRCTGCGQTQPNNPPRPRTCAECGAPLALWDPQAGA